ncbi:MAG: transposase, partial [Rickettsia endosymbiont of Ixodes persulcatus]|nr:transposase [Rickettsia endosymbiont of Ixodes persulcatus]
MTSLAHHWKEEGIQQGIEKGMQLGKAEGKYEVAKNMLISDSDFISKVTGLSMDEINKLKNN